MSSAPMALLYLSSSAAQESIHPSSATWENTKPSARMNWAPEAIATARASLLAPGEEEGRHSDTWLRASQTL